MEPKLGLPSLELAPLKLPPVVAALRSPALALTDPAQAHVASSSCFEASLWRAASSIALGSLCCLFFFRFDVP